MKKNSLLKRSLTTGNTYGETVNRGLITERLLNLDTGDGAWRIELVVELNQNE